MVLSKIDNNQFPNVVLYKFVNDEKNYIKNNIYKFLLELGEKYDELIEHHTNKTIVILLDTLDFKYIQRQRCFVHSSLRLKATGSTLNVNNILYNDFLTVCTINGIFVSDYELCDIGIEKECRKLIDIGF